MHGNVHVRFGRGSPGRVQLCWHLARRPTSFYGLHPIVVSVANTGDVLAVLLRNGNAGSNTVVDHIAVLTEAIAQIPVRYRKKIIFRADGAGATKDLLSWIKAEAAVRGYTWHYSVGFDVTESVRTAITEVPADVWVPSTPALRTISYLRAPRTSRLSVPTSPPPPAPARTCLRPSFRPRPGPPGSPPPPDQPPTGQPTPRADPQPAGRLMLPENRPAVIKYPGTYPVTASAPRRYRLAAARSGGDARTRAEHHALTPVADAVGASAPQVARVGLERRGGLPQAGFE